MLRLLLAAAGDERNRIVLATIAAGVAMGAVLAVVNTVTEYDKNASAQVTLIGVFILSCATFLYAKSYALNGTARVVEALLDRTRTRFAEKIRRADMRSIEGLQRRIAVTLPRDTQTLSEAGTIIVHGFSSGVMLCFSAFYVATLSLLAFAITIVLFGSAVYFYKRSQERSADILRSAAQADTQFYNAFLNLLNGFKEVKISTARGDDLQENYIATLSEATHHHRVASAQRFNAGANITNFFFYLLMGVLVFGLPQNEDSAEVAAKVINVVIFVGSAIEIVLRALPMLARANFAIDNLEELERKLDAADEKAAESTAKDAPVLKEGISCRMISYSYFDPAGQPLFSVGPLDLEIKAGEVLFIVGGNGSGKSTLLRLVTRLYEPQSGVMMWDGRRVDQSNLTDYRNLFSAIFSDFHLFDRLYGLDGVDPDTVQGLLERMQLQHKTRYEDGRFSEINLSTGQRKRLALLTTLLEGKQISIFDEWAADQDPEFRKYFYEVLVPEWRSQGKTLVIVSHDDRYFHVADRVIFMEDGRTVERSLAE
ncbi:cyclic peptide export ABC transporter [Acuticoccus kandeliae]|uniref:cyclic peptide export ABC transporter n=1 Tax=Acuticoccus kandeliae TaxID=2073160 RepID=UPI000D3E73A6|nr:cyclic peptide export ABC transporter [Acuticoccus kandeliae]